MKTFKKIWKFFLINYSIITICYIGIYTYAYFAPKLPINSANGFFFYDKDGNSFTANTNEEWVPLKDISPYLINATISIEDKRFFSHQGFDFLRILKSMYINLVNRKTLQGASTITQQYAKNLFLDFDRTWERKLEEAWITVRLESHYSKEELLEGYLNTINYGGIFGIENASWYYFQKSSKDLSLAEATILAGIPKWPSEYSPLVNEKASKERQKLILNSMVKNHMITEEEKENALKEKLTYSGMLQKDNLVTLMYYEDAVLKELNEIKSIPSSFLKTGGLKIYTNLDMNAQKILEENIHKQVDDVKDFQVASIMMDPNNGKVIALTGGTNYFESNYNRAISSKRQVGSTMKPFLYYTALENGFTPSTTFTSEKTIFTFSENKTYSPSNYSNKYPNKPISMAAALAFSDNIYAVKTHLFLGEDSLVKISKELGISNDMKEIPSAALGSTEIGMMNMMKGYATLANEGYSITPYFIKKIEDTNGNILYEKKEKKEKKLNKSIVFILNEMLTNCYNTEFIDYTYPTCMTMAPTLTHKYAIKSGTTDTDHLIFGYTKNMLLGIWGGYDDNRESDISNGTKVKQIWADTMETFYQTNSYEWYQIPDNIVGVFVDPITGLLADTNAKKRTMLYYIKGTEPSSDYMHAIIPKEET